MQLSQRTQRATGQTVTFFHSATKISLITKNKIIMKKVFTIVLLAFSLFVGGTEIYAQKEASAKAKEKMKTKMSKVNGTAKKNTSEAGPNSSIEENVRTYCSDSVADNWNLEGLRQQYINLYLMRTDLRYSVDDLNELSNQDIIDFIQKRGNMLYELREKEVGSEQMREVERVCLLKTVDKHWMDHIDAMDELRNGIGLRGYAQRKPVEEYRFEGFNMFDEMIAAIREQTVRMVLTMPVRAQVPLQREQVMRPDTPGGPQTPYRSEKRAAKKAKKAAKKP